MKIDKPPEADGRKPLFRQQAVAYQARPLEGEVLLSLSMRMRVLIALAVVVIVAVVIFATSASYSRIETVPGWVVPEDGMIRVTAQRGGVVEELSVAEGDLVSADKSLAVLRLSSDTEAGDAGSAIEAHLATQVKAVRSEADAQKEKLRAQGVSLRAQRDGLVRQLNAGKARVEITQKRLELARANADRVAEIAERGFASASNVEETEMNVLLAEQDVSQVQLNVLEAERQIQSIDAELRALPMSIRAAEAQAQASEAALAQKETEVEVQNTYHVGATVGGRVVALPVARGQTVAPQSVLVVITPHGSSLEAELYVPSRSAGFIKPGQEVRLMYQAFPYQKFGTAEGTVRSVSRTVLAPAEVAIPGLDVREPVFRVKVTLASEVVNAYGQEIPVQPGMMVSAGIVTDSRSLLEWLLDPLYAVGRLG